MKSLGLFAVWTLVFVLLLLGFDQLLLRYPAKQPVLREISAFHADFRTRLLSLMQKPGAPAPSSDSIPAASETPLPENSALRKIPVASDSSQKKSPAKDAGPGYVYADAGGSLQFVDRLEEVPARYRASARPLSR